MSIFTVEALVIDSALLCYHNRLYVNCEHRVTRKIELSHTHVLDQVLSKKWPTLSLVAIKSIFLDQRACRYLMQ